MSDRCEKIEYTKRTKWTAWNTIDGISQIVATGYSDVFETKEDFVQYLKLILKIKFERICSENIY